MTKLQLQKFTPGTFIEINDVVKGFRKLGLVTDGGDMYYDELGPTCTPFLIYAAQQPEEVGNTLTWGLELADKPAESKQYAALQQRLNDNEALDTLVKARALLWARRNQVYSYDRALAESKAATKLVLDSHEMKDRLNRKALSAGGQA